MTEEKLNLNAFLDFVLENSIDKEIGYLRIAKKNKDLKLKPFLERKHIESCQHTIDLKKSFLSSNIIPYQNDFSSNSKYKKWMNSKSILEISDIKKIINEIIIAEQKCIIDYNMLLNNDDLPKTLKLVLQNQKKTSENNLIELRNM